MSSEKEAGDATDFGVLRSIATYHREHERYYTAHSLAQAAELSREANKLKVVADVWLSDQPAAPAPRADFADPRYRAAGCDDLNALRAIASIGILFMEGEGEPAEIRGLKARLRGMSMAMVASGQWLADKMEAAWERERVLLSPELIEAAWPRFQTIITNWQGCRTTALVGRLLALATDRLDRIDFSPAAVRSHRQRCGRDLRTAGWIIDLAARLLAQSGSALATNDLHWTEYRAVLDRFAGAHH